jgi:hypothetical protein
MVKVVLAVRQQVGMPAPLAAAHLDKPAALQCSRGLLMSLIRPRSPRTSVSDPLQNGNLAGRQLATMHPSFI